MKTIRTNTKSPYSICIEAGLRSRIPEMLAEFPGRKLAVVSDDTVDSLYARDIARGLSAAGRDVCRMAFPHGEGSKTLATVQEVYRFLSENAITRADMIVAVGGGVVGDLAGFAAATWLRGIPFVQVPTTLLAMVDSSVGGKTGVDLPEGKNLVGAFWQPAMVICDPETLKTLPAETFADGMAEAIKTGAILDAELFSLIEKGGLRENEALMEETVARCVDHKRAVVEQDERDKGVRQWLNFGHTLGHAIERESGYAIPHGRAVSIGMVLITRICERQGVTPAGTADRIAACCARYSLPIATEYSLEALCRHCMGDKKRAGSEIKLVILESLGKAALYPVEAQKLLPFLKGEAQ